MATDETEAIGKRLRRLRRERDWTQDQLSDMTDIQQGAVSKWERGETRPGLPNLLKLAKLFGQTVDGLVQGTDLEAELKSALEAGTHPVRGTYTSAPSSSVVSSTESPEGGVAEQADPLTRAALSEAAAKLWAPPHDQEQYGRDLLRAAAFFKQLGVALATGQAAVVSRPAADSTTRHARPRRRVSRLLEKKKSRRAG